MDRSNGARLNSTRLAERRIAYRNQIAEWCLDQTERALRRGSLNESLLWCNLCARALLAGCSPLVSPRLDRVLAAIAGQLPVPEFAPRTGSRQRWLHVIDRALPYGGHTAMASRWIQRDHTDGNVHSVALISQASAVPDALTAAVHRSGGQVWRADAESSQLARAGWLREIAFAEADRVVLHVDGHNVMAPVAFGVNGGPPVLLVNHAAHLFWTGGPVIDRVLNCRGSALEQQWTRRHRGIGRCETLPIPIPPGTTGRDAETRQAARRELGLPADAVVLLTVGDGFKYTPAMGLDFAETALAILRAHTTAHLVVVGPEKNSYWERAARAAEGRMRLAGRQHNLAPYHAAADVYLEGFPFGSTTAFLEAADLGIPALLAPEVCPPPFGTDGVALDDLTARPATVAEYIRQAGDLIASPRLREERGGELARSVRRHHSGEGWRDYLKKAAGDLPLTHRVYPVVDATPPPHEMDLYWTQFAAAFANDPLQHLVQLAVEWGLRPRITPSLLQACWRAQGLRPGKLSPALLLALSFLPPGLPARARMLVYRGALGALRAAAFTRALGRA